MTKVAIRGNLQIDMQHRLVAMLFGIVALVDSAQGQVSEHACAGLSCASVCIHHGKPTNGSLTGDVSLPDSGMGYYHELGTDPRDTDDWACHDWLILKILSVASDLNSISNLRIGILDLSKKGGGLFKPHRAHQNGLDVDVRYAGGDDYEGPIDFDKSSSRYYDKTNTQQVIDKFCETGNEKIFVDRRSELSGKCILYHRGHSNHFHVQYPNPH